MYKFVLTCLLLAWTGYYAVEGLCVDGIGSLNALVTNTSKPDTPCTGENQRCARTSATVSGYNQVIRGVAMQCANQTLCESLKNLATCQQFAIAFVSSKTGLPTSTITSGACEAVCCMTDNCNSKSVAEIKAMASAAPSKTARKVTQAPAPVTTTKKMVTLVTSAPTMPITSGAVVSEVSMIVLLLSVFANL